MYHVGGSVISYGSTQKLYYNFRNNLILLLKNEKGSKLIWLFPLRLVLDGIAGARLLFMGQFTHMLTIIRAHFHFYKHLGRWWRARKATKKLIITRNETGIYSGSIVLDYFLFRKKKFPSIGWKTTPLD